MPMLKYQNYGYSNKTKKVSNSYDEAIEIAKQRDYLISERNIAIEEIHEIKYKIETYYYTYSDADEYETTIEDLQNELEEAKLRLEYLEDEIKKIENNKERN